MTEEEAIALAADWYDSGKEDRDEFIAMVSVLIASVSAAEREACAGICDRFHGRGMVAAECAGAIRMLSNGVESDERG